MSGVSAGGFIAIYVLFPSREYSTNETLTITHFNKPQRIENYRKSDGATDRIATVYCVICHGETPDTIIVDFGVLLPLFFGVYVIRELLSAVTYVRASRANASFT